MLRRQAVNEHHSVYQDPFDLCLLATAQVGDRLWIWKYECNVQCIWSPELRSLANISIKFSEMRLFRTFTLPVGGNLKLSL